MWQLAAACCLLAVGSVMTSCSDDDSDAPLNFYSSVRLTAAEFIEADDAQFSDFKYILQKGNYLGMLKTYGHYTVFAPTNDAIQQYLKEKGYPIARRTVAKYREQLGIPVGRMRKKI